MCIIFMKWVYFMLGEGLYYVCTYLQIVYCSSSVDIGYVCRLYYAYKHYEITYSFYEVNAQHIPRSSQIGVYLGIS